MLRHGFGAAIVALWCAAVAGAVGAPQVAAPVDRSSAAQGTAGSPAADGPAGLPAADGTAQRALLDRYCVSCHSERLKSGGLVLESLDMARFGEDAELGEKVVRKLRAGMMPPSGLPRPDAQSLELLISWMEARLDRHGDGHLVPPGPHRLNRTEYQNAIRDLLGLTIDATKFLPVDNSTHGFDNIAGALTTSPALLDAYLSAAGKISRLAIGNATAPSEVVVKVPEDVTQNYHVPGLPFGTRGGILIPHEFPADGEYVFKITPVAEGNMGQTNLPFGKMRGEQLQVLVDGRLVTVFDWDKDMQGLPVRNGADSPRIRVSAGPHTVGVTFVATNYAPNNDLNAPFARATIDTGASAGFSFYPHVGIVRILGPFAGARPAETPSRARIFACRPASVREERPCAQTILRTLTRRAFRRPVSDADVRPLLEFYDSGRDGGSFEDGIEKALRRLLADPEFVYRIETAPATVKTGEVYPIGAIALASRLSFFLWSSIPDDELLGVAEEGRLLRPEVLQAQVRRMLADPKAAALVENFTGQWLNLRGLDAFTPNANVYPDFDDNLRQAFRREVELFFQSVAREDRSIIDLLDADYTFVDERLASHYGIRNVYGSDFRRVVLPAALDMRRGLLGKGALQAVTSQPTRTSPVARGKWFLQTFLGVSPPDPPPNVDTTLKEDPKDAASNVKALTMRQVSERHRQQPACATCHKIFEPIGFALEHFDAIGAYRTTDEGSPIDAAGEIPDGTKIDGVGSLRAVLLRYQDQFARVFAEKLLTYGLGRGVEAADMPLVRALVRDAKAADYRFSAFVLGVAKSAPFQRSEKGATAPAAMAARH